MQGRRSMQIHLRWENNYVIYTSSQMYKTIIRRYLAHYLARTLFVFKYHWTLQNSKSCEFSSLAQKIRRKRMSHQSASCNGSNLEVVWLALPVVSLSITFIFFQWIYCQKYSLHLSCKAWKKSNQYLQALHKVSKNLKCGVKHQLAIANA